MGVMIPEEDELRSRILAHLSARPGNPLVAAVWSGYLAGLIEWGVLEPDAHSRLSNLLPKSGSLETVEILLGTDYLDEHPEFREEILSSGDT